MTPTVQRTPSVTIVIPVHGKSALTRRCLQTLQSSDLPAGVEVLVVDDASPDDTATVLADFPDVAVLSRGQQSGFAGACNDGVAAARTEWVCLLNNDTEPQPGWLQALLTDVSGNPGTAAVGARLLFPGGSVQHAGVVIGRDRHPHHAYVGFPGDHPAVLRSRDMQVVTAACLLLHRQTFLALGGFDRGFRNGHEDVDLCLRLRAAGHRVRYCADAVVTHLESATRGRGGRQAAENARRYLQRWADVVEPDDLETYAADDLLNLAYDGDTTPLRLTVDPLLANGGSGRTHDLERLEGLLRLRSRQVAELLADNVSLTIAVGRASAIPKQRAAAAGDRDDAVQVALDGLRRALSDRIPASESVAGAVHRVAVRQVRDAVAQLLSDDAVVVVLSRGDDQLLDLPMRARHFPADRAGRWLGFHPADGPAALRMLHEACAVGATHLVVPAWEQWWLDYYPELTAALPAPLGDPEIALIFATADVSAAAAS